MDGDDGVASLMIGGHFLLVVGHHHGFPFDAHHHLVLGLLEIDHGDEALALTRGQKRGFVDQIGKVRTGKARRAARNGPAIDVRCNRHFAHMDGQDLFPTLDIRAGNNDLAVKAARTQQSRVEHIGAVGCGDDDDAFVGVEPVHFDQQLVQRLLALVIAAAKASAAVATDGVNFVDEDDAGRRFLRLLEHVADPAGTDTDKHFNKVGAGNVEERHIGLPGNGAGQQGFAGSGGANQECALGDFAAKAVEFGRVLQKVDNLPQFFPGFVDAGDIVKGDAALFLIQQLCTGFAKAHRAASLAILHLPHHEQPDADHQGKGQDRKQQLHEDGAFRLRLHLKPHAFVAQPVDQRRIERGIGLKGGVVGQPSGNIAAADLHILHGAFTDLGQEV